MVRIIQEKREIVKIYIEGSQHFYAHPGDGQETIVFNGGLIISYMFVCPRKKQKQQSTS